MHLQKSLVVIGIVVTTATAVFAQSKPQSAGATPQAAAPLRRHRQPDWWGHHKKKKKGDVRRSTGPYDNRVGLPLMKHIAGDQKSIWTSPFHLRLRDANWLVPLAGLAAALVATDSATCRRCHSDESSIDPGFRRGRREHKMALQKGITCIACHYNLVHSPVEPREKLLRLAQGKRDQ